VPLGQVRNRGGDHRTFGQNVEKPAETAKFHCLELCVLFPVSFRTISPREGLGRVSEHLRQRLQKKPLPPFASFPPASLQESPPFANAGLSRKNRRQPSEVAATLLELRPTLSRSSRRHPSRASPGLLPGVVAIAADLSIAAENFAPARGPPCAALSKICADLRVGASPGLPLGVVAAALCGLPPGLPTE